MLIFLLIVHGLCAVALLGAITHQVLSAWRGGGAERESFVGAFRAVRGPAYANAVVVLYLISLVLGDVVYATYRLDVKPLVLDMQMFPANGIFEIKEHLAAIGMMMLPAYWYLWQKPLLDETAAARRNLTTLLAFFVWWSFLTGHILNNIKGVGV